MFYAIFGGEAPLVRKLQASSFEAAQKEVSEVIGKNAALFGGIKILHVIGECDFDIAKWKENNPKKTTTSYTNQEIAQMYSDFGGEC